MELEDAQRNPRRAIVLGAGVAGMTAAHELALRGFQVHVVERAQVQGAHGPNVGGLASSEYSYVARDALHAVKDQEEPFDLAELEHRPVAAVLRLSLGSDPRASTEWYDVDTGWQGHANEKRDTADPGPPWMGGWAKRGIGRDEFDTTLYLSDSSIPTDDFVSEMTDGWIVRAHRTVVDSGLSKEVLAGLGSRALDRWAGGAILVVRFVASLPGAPPHDAELLRFAGEHGYRFFPSFYRHVFDTMERIPVWQFTHDDMRDRVSGRKSDNIPRVPYRSVYDNLISNDFFVLATEGGELPVPIPRKRIVSITEAFRLQRVFHRKFGIPLRDLLRYQARLLQYMTTCTLRRDELERVKWSDYLRLDDGFSDEFIAMMNDWPQALVGLNGGEADVRTFGNIIVQQLFDQVLDRKRRDATLNGPTSEAWFYHWRQHLEIDLGVKFHCAEAVALRFTRISETLGREVRVVFRNGLGYEDDSEASRQPAWWGTEFAKLLTGQGVTPPTQRCLPSGAYLVLAVDPREAVRLGETLRWNQEPSARDEELEARWNQSVLPKIADMLRGRNGQPFLPRQLREQRPADCLRHYSGVQYFFVDFDVPFARGHVYLPKTSWRLSAISQEQFRLRRSPGFAIPGVLSVDIGDFCSPSKDGAKKTAFAATRKQLIEFPLADIYRSVRSTNEPGGFGWFRFQPIGCHVSRGLVYGDAESKLPAWCCIEAHEVEQSWPDLYLNAWYVRPSDLGERKRPKPGSLGGDRLLFNNTPYFPQPPVAIGCGPGRLDEREPERGYEVEFNNLVVCGSHMATFTRLGSMEAANESGRHAFNGIMRDELFESSHHMSLPPSGEQRRRFRPVLTSDVKFGAREARDGFADIIPMEWQEPDDLQFWKEVDERLYREELPHIFEILRIDSLLRDLLGRGDDPTGAAASAENEAKAQKTIDNLFEVLTGTEKNLDGLLGLLPKSWLAIVDRLLARTR